jgi:hypothetical protein
MYLLGMYGASLDLASITKNFDAGLFTRSSYVVDTAISSIRHVVPEDGSDTSLETPVAITVLPWLSLPVTNLVTTSNPYYEGNGLVEVKITVLPAKGTLYGQNSGGEWEAITAVPFSVARNDSAAMDEELRYKVRYRPPAHEFDDTGLASFTYTIQNTRGATGVLSSTSSLFVTPVNDAPVPTQTVITKAIDWTKTASSEVFPRINFGTGATTIETGASELTNYSATAGPTYGKLVAVAGQPLQADYKYDLTKQASIADTGTKGNGWTILFTDSITFTLLDNQGAESFSSEAGSAVVDVLNPLVGGGVSKGKDKWCIIDSDSRPKTACRGRLDCVAFPARYGLTAASECKAATVHEYDDATWVWAQPNPEIIDLHGYDYGASAQPDTLGGRNMTFQIKPGDLTSKGTLYQYTGDDTSPAAMKGAQLVVESDGYAEVTDATLVGSNQWTGRMVFIPATGFTNYPQYTGFQWQEYCLQWFVEQGFTVSTLPAVRWLPESNLFPTQCTSSVFSIETKEVPKRPITGAGSTIVMPYRMKTGDGGLSPPVDHHLYVRAMPSTVSDMPTLPMSKSVSAPMGIPVVDDCIDVASGAVTIEVESNSKTTFSFCGFPPLTGATAAHGEGSGDWMVMVTKKLDDPKLMAPAEYLFNNNGLRESSSKENTWGQRWCNDDRVPYSSVTCCDTTALRAACEVVKNKNADIEFYGAPENVDKAMYGLRYQPAVRHMSDIGKCENDVLEVVLFNTLLAVGKPLLAGELVGNPYAPIKMRLNVTTCVKALAIDSMQCTTVMGFLHFCSPKAGSDAECKAIGCRFIIGSKTATLILVLIFLLAVLPYLIYKTFFWLLGLAFGGFFTHAKYDLKLIEEDEELEPVEQGLLTLQMVPDKMRKGSMHFNVKEGDYLKLELSAGTGELRVANSMVQATGTVDLEVALKQGQWNKESICQMLQRCLNAADKHAKYNVHLAAKSVQMEKKQSALRSSSVCEAGADEVEDKEAMRTRHRSNTTPDDFVEADINVLQIVRTRNEASELQLKNPAAAARVFKVGLYGSLCDAFFPDLLLSYIS